MNIFTIENVIELAIEIEITVTVKHHSPIRPRPQSWAFMGYLPRGQHLVHIPT